MAEIVDLDQYIGGDLSVSLSGDLQTCSGVLRSEQRLYRRLLTNPGSYLFELTYGAGVGLAVGQPQMAATVKALINSQIFLEDSVAQSPPPVVQVAPIDDGITCNISFTESSTRKPVLLSFDGNA